MKNLKNLAFLILLFLCVSILNAQEIVKTKVNHATIFFNSAQVERDVTVQLKKGENTVQFLNIENYIVPKTLQVIANESITILTSVHTVVKNNATFQTKEEKKWIDSLAIYNKQYQVLNFQIQNFQNEKSMILSNKEIRGAASGFDLTDLTQLAQYYRKSLNAIDLEMMEIREEMNSINASKVRMNAKLVEIGYTQNVGIITSKIISDKAQTVKMRLQYMLNSVFWTPFYDIKATGLDKPIEIITKGNISQNSSVHWENVNMTLSTSIPTVYGVKPELTPWYLNYLSNKKRYLDRGYGQENSYYKADESMKSKAGMLSNAKTAKDFTTLRDNIVAKEYEIGLAYSIKNNGSAVVEIQENNAEADFYYYTAPKVAKKVYLLADISKWEELDLIQGEANIYLNGVFMGSTYMDPSIVDDTMSLMIGEDKTVQVDRKKLNQFCTNSTFGGSKKTEMAMQVVVKNNKSKSIRIIVEDQVPLSSVDKIEVTVENVSNAKHDKESGILTWEFTLTANESKSLDIKYVVKHPKNKRINL